MNDVLWDLDLAGLLMPTQEITGPPALLVRLEERFSTLTWVDTKALDCRESLHHDRRGHPVRRAGTACASAWRFSARHLPDAY
jgi:hypothetical protein